MDNLIDLENATLENTQCMTLDGQKLRCKVISVYDADTVTIVFPFFGRLFKEKCRLYGIDSSEIRTKNLEEKAHAYTSRDWLKERILNNIVYIQFYDWDKYGRLLGDIYETETSTETINSILVNNKMAYVYTGKTKQKFEEWSK